MVARRTGWALSTEEAPTAGTGGANRVANMALGKTSTEGLLGEHAEMLFVAEVTSALLIGFLVGKWSRSLVIFAILYVLHAIPAALGWYGALSEWDDLPYWVAGFMLDAAFVAIGVGLRRVVTAKRREDQAHP